MSDLTLAGIKAQQQAADPNISAWVSASAGSGKTRVLVDRTLRLMLAGTAPERILCITFTKAAAAEMANRLNKTLGTWSVMSNDDLIDSITELRGSAPSAEELIRARQLFASVLDAPGGIKIQTIHSFCGSILGRFPLEAGISPNFQELDDRTASEMMEVARDRLLVATRDGDDRALEAALRLVSEKVTEQDFAQLMQSLSSRRGRLKRFLKSYEGLQGAKQHIAQLIDVDPDLTEAEIMDAACAEHSFNGVGLRGAVEALLNGGKRDQGNAHLMERWLAAPNERQALFDHYVGAFLKQTGDVKSDSYLASATAVKHMGDIHEAMHAEADRLLQVQEGRRRVRVFASTMAMLKLAERLLSEYEREKTRRGALDFDDLILITRDLLRKVDVTPWVMFKLDGGIDHILVDEAQDTSPEQWEVINALTEEFFSGDSARDHGRTVFVVGDEKQSIYSFQGADPAAFEHMRQLFETKALAAQKQWKKVPMDLSFRSTHAVLSLVDETFAPATARQGLTAGAEEIRHHVHRIGQAGFTEIWPIVRPNAEEESDPWEIPVDQGLNVSPAAQLAKNIAQQIRCWLDSGEILAAKGRAIEPKDIMILVQRRNSLFTELVRALKQGGVPVAGADRMQLTEQLAVMDLVALAKFVLLPDDDLNLAIILKGPFVGCDDNELFELAYGRSGSLWSALQDYNGAIGKFGEAVGFLKSQLGRADFVPVYEFFAEILGRERGREKILARLGEEALDPVEEFLSLALAYQRSEATSLQSFLHWLQAGGAEIKRDMEQEKNEVRILTVHGSKGLQAPIVFLPDTCQGGRDQSYGKVIWSEAEIPAPIWPIKKENFDSYSLKARAALNGQTEDEKKRLLYVALTRAEDRIYVCGWENKNKRPEGCWYDLIDAAFSSEQPLEIEEVKLPFGDIARRRSSGEGVSVDADMAVKTPLPQIPSLPEWVWQHPAAEPFPPQPLTPSREEEEPAVRSPLGSDDGHRFHRGILIHRLLESLPTVAREARADVASKWLARAAHGLSENQQRQILQETLAVLEHPEFGDIFGPESRAEVPLTGLMGDRIMSGQIDRLLIGKDEILIVDYKTNRPSPRLREDVPEVYVRQMAIYHDALKKMYPEKRIKCGLLWTDGPHLMTLFDT